jgi:conjugal transfer/entry exclusion protein
MKRLLKEITLGVLLAALLLPAPMSVQAQWTVFDPTSFTLQIRKEVQEINRWIQTVQQYTQMYTNAVGQLTNLQGILKTADELFAQDKRLRTLISNWGQVIRMSFQIKNQLINLITGNLKAIHNIAERLRNGIFDPAQDRADFEEYLRNGIGRTAQNTESELERLKKMDNQFERLEYDHQIAADKAAQLQVFLNGKREEIERLKACLECTEKDRDIERLSFDLAKLEEQFTVAQADSARLFDLKAKRAEEIYRVEMQRLHFGQSIRSMNKAWGGITTATQELREKLAEPNEQ